MGCYGIEWLYLCILFPASGWCPSIYSSISGKKETQTQFLFILIWPLENPLGWKSWGTWSDHSADLFWAELDYNSLEVPANLTYPMVLWFSPLSEHKMQPATVHSSCNTTICKSMEGRNGCVEWEKILVHHIARANLL